MTETEKLAMLKTLLGVDISDKSEKDRLDTLLKLAQKEIMSWRYSNKSDMPDKLPEEYETTQIYAVVAGFSMLGAENQTSHSENGISRVFRHADMVHYIRSNVIPFVGVPE